jgi:hypothetical protein
MNGRKFVLRLLLTSSLGTQTKRNDVNRRNFALGLLTSSLRVTGTRGTTPPLPPSPPSYAPSTTEITSGGRIGASLSSPPDLASGSHTPPLPPLPFPPS